MEHKASEHIKEQYDTEVIIKTEVEKAAPSAAYVDIEIDLIHLKQETGSVQFMKSESAILVKKEILEDSTQDSSSNLVHGSEEGKHQRFRCDECPKVFKYKIYLNQHSKLMHGTESHKCTQCYKEFKCKQYLLRHVRYKHNKEQYCEICKKMCKSRAALRYHVTTFHHKRFPDLKDGKYCCDKCTKTFQFKSHLNRHCEGKHGSERHKCAECNSEYKCLRYLRNHIYSVHKKQEFECDICKKIFKSRRGIQYHILRHNFRRLPDSSKQVHGSEEHKHQHYTCDKCLKVYKSEQILWLHSKRKHGIESHKCTQCNREFKCEEYLLNHLQNTHSKEQYECDICKKQCKSKIGLRCHVSRIHRHRSSASYNQQGNESTSTLAIVSSAGEAVCSADHRKGSTIKQELNDIDLDIGPTVLQHMDSTYRTNWVKVEQLKVENAPMRNEQIVKIEPDLSMTENVAGVNQHYNNIRNYFY